MSRKDLLTLFPLLKLPNDLKEFFSKEAVMKKEEEADAKQGKEVDTKENIKDKPSVELSHDGTTVPVENQEKSPKVEVPPAVDSNAEAGKASTSAPSSPTEAKEVKADAGLPKASPSKRAVLISFSGNATADAACSCKEKETPMGSEKGGTPPPEQPLHDTSANDTAFDAKDGKKPKDDSSQGDEDKKAKPKYHWRMKTLRTVPDAVLFSLYKSLVEFIYWHEEQEKWLEGVEEVKKEIPLREWSKMYEEQRQGLSVVPVDDEKKLKSYTKAFAQRWLSEWRRYQ